MRVSRGTLEILERVNGVRKPKQFGTGLLTVARFRHLSDEKSLDILEAYLENKVERSWAIALFLPTAKAMLSQDPAQIRKYLVEAAATAISWVNVIDKEKESKDK